MKNKTIWVCFLILSLLQIPLLIPFFHKGIFATHDNVQVVRIFEMFQSIKYGSFPANWCSGLLYGHGYPLYVFYSPLVYYIGAIFAFLGLNFINATKIVFLIGFVFGPWGMYLLARKIFNSDISAVISAVAFSLAPYRAVDVYVRGALAEFIAFSLMPWILWINIRIWEEKKEKTKILSGWLALLMAMIILTHNLSAVMILFFLVFLNFYYFCKEKARTSRILSIFLSGLLSLTIACFYWLPLLFEKSLVQLGQLSNYPYALYFQNFGQLWNSPWGFLGSNDVGGMSLMLGKIFIGTSLLGFVLNLFIKTKRRVLLLLLFLFGVLLVFMETKFSLFVWERVSFLPYLQFPWRLHTLLTIILSILCGSVIFLIDKRKLISILLSVGILTVIFFENISHFTKAIYDNGPSVSETTTWNDEYMPVWVKEKPKDYAPDKIWFASGSGEIKNIEWGYLKKSATITTSERSLIRIAQVYYPGWTAEINGLKAVINYNNIQGLSSVEIPKGTNQIDFLFINTWYRKLANIISLLGFSVLLIIFFNSARHEKNK